MIDWLFNTARFHARSDCGEWHRWEVVALVMADLGLAACFFFLASQYHRMSYRRRRPRAFHQVARSSAVFLTACGIVAALDAVSFYWPAYPLRVIVIVGAAIAALWAVLNSSEAFRDVDESLNLVFGNGEATGLDRASIRKSLNEIATARMVRDHVRRADYRVDEALLKQIERMENAAIELEAKAEELRQRHGADDERERRA